MPEREGERRRSGCSFCKGFLLGGAIGAGLAFLFAPRMGRETRKLVKEKTSPFRERMEKKWAEIKEKVDRFFEEHGEEVERLKMEAQEKLAATARGEAEKTFNAEEVERKAHQRKRTKRSRRPRETHASRNAEESSQTESEK